MPHSVGKPSKSSSDHVVTTFGRMSPPTAGHVKLINKIKSLAKHHGADHLVFVSPTHDKDKNPLTHSDKIRYLERMAPNTNYHKNIDVKNPLEAVKHLARKYKKVTFVVGQDRVHEFNNLLHHYNGEDYNVDQLHVVSAGDRDPDSNGIKGASATSQREAAKAGNYNKFKKGLGHHADEETAKHMYQKVRAGMKVENYRAVMMFAGPGSGKDHILKSTMLSETAVKEVDLNKFEQYIQLGKSILEVEKGMPLVVNGLGNDKEKIIAVHTFLENAGYDVAGLYVYTTNETSRARNEQRIRLNAKTITESLRNTKWHASLDTARALKEQFSKFWVIDNSSIVLSEQFESWLVELNEQLTEHFCGCSPIDEAVTTWLNGVSSQSFPMSLVKTKIDKKIDKNHPSMKPTDAPDKRADQITETAGTSVSSVGLPPKLNANDSLPKAYLNSRHVKNTVVGKNRTNASTISVPPPPTAVHTGPLDSRSTNPGGKRRFSEEVITETLPKFSDFRKHKADKGSKTAKVPDTTVFGNQRFHANPGAGIISTDLGESAIIWNSSRKYPGNPHLKPTKRLKNPDTIRPQDSIGGATVSNATNGSPSLAGSLAETRSSGMSHSQAIMAARERKAKEKEKNKPAVAAPAPPVTSDARAGDGMAGVETLGENSLQEFAMADQNIKPRQHVKMSFKSSANVKAPDEGSYGLAAGAPAGAGVGAGGLGESVKAKRGFSVGQVVKFNGKSVNGDVEGFMPVRVIDPHSNAHLITHSHNGKDYEGTSSHIPSATVEREAYKNRPAKRFEAYHHTLSEAAAGQGPSVYKVKGNKKPVPFVAGDSRVTPVAGETQLLATESITFGDFRKSLRVNPSDSEYVIQSTNEEYEDWGISGEEFLFEGRVIKTNKPFREGSHHSVYVKETDGTIRKLSFQAKHSLMLSEAKPNSVEFWESK